eukprot:bmy_05031T0
MQGAGGARPGSHGGAGDRQGPGLCRGEIEFGGSGKKRGKFVKVPSGVAPSVLFDLLLAEWHLPAPNLAVSLVGEERPFALKPWLRDVLRKGLVKAAQSTRAWILTSALRVGLARYVGQAVRDHSLASTSTEAAWWPSASPHSAACCTSASGRRPGGQPCPLPHGRWWPPGPPLRPGQRPGRPGEGSEPTERRLRLEKHISEQRTGYGRTGSIEIPVLCLLVNGDPSTLERISRAVEHAGPWLILAGSGGIADVLAALMNQPHLLVPQVAKKQFRETFPSENFSWEDIVHWTELLRNITSHPHLLTVHDFEQEGPEELDTVILKALSRHLEEVMMDALVSNKPQFVRLFVDGGADVADFLTYGRLQQLYLSAPPKSLPFHLLRRKREEGWLTLAGLGTQQAREPPPFSLHEVSRVLKDFLHDACRGLYQAVSCERAAGGRAGPRLRADTPVPQEQGPARRPTGQKGLLDLNQRSESPWRDLFLWAVLQNRHEMATYFWTMGQEGVAAALAACRILKEMSHLETEAEVGRTPREAKYEQLALGAQPRHEECTFALLVRRNHSWSRTTCLHLATEADTKAFFAHDGVQAFLTKIWWGDMASGTPILRLLGAFLCPALVFTDLITFRPVRTERLGGLALHWGWWRHEAPLRTGPEDPQGLDSLDAEKRLLCGPGSRAAELAKALRTQSSRGPRAAFLLRCWRKFWGAPVTVFLGNVIMYFSFLFLFTYVLLVDFRPPPQGLSGAEVTLYFWVFTLVLEEIWQGFFTDEDTRLVKKVTLYVEDNRNKCDMAAIFLFIVGVTCRSVGPRGLAGAALLGWWAGLPSGWVCSGPGNPVFVCPVLCVLGEAPALSGHQQPSSLPYPRPVRMLPSVSEAGRTILAIDFMVFTLRLIHTFAIHKQLGPKIIIVERMVSPRSWEGSEAEAHCQAGADASLPTRLPPVEMKDVFFFLFFLSVWLVAYGVTSQALLHPHDRRLEWIFRCVLYRPYLQIIRQIPLDEIDEARVNRSVHPLLLEGSPSCPNLYANRLVIVLLVTFLLVTNVLLVNLFIATFRATRTPSVSSSATTSSWSTTSAPPWPRPGPALHPPQPPEPGAQEVLPEGGPAEAGTPGEGPAGAPGPEDGHLGGGAEELPERAGEAEEGQRGGAAAEDGPQVRGPGPAPPPRWAWQAAWDSRNFSGGNPQASAARGGGLGSRKHPEAGRLPSNT